MSLPRVGGHPKNVYVEEGSLVPGLDVWLASLFDEDHADDTCAVLAGASEPDPDVESEQATYEPPSPTATASPPTIGPCSTPGMP